MITQSYLNTEIDLARRISIYYTDKLLGIYLVGNKDIQPWYNDSLQIDYLLNALMACDVINGAVFIGSNQMDASYLSGLSARIREFLNYELRQIVYAELDSSDNISITIPSEPPTVITTNTPMPGWIEYQIDVVINDIAEVSLPFNIAIADVYSLSVTVNDHNPISLAAPDEEGCHIVGTVLFWHNYYNLKAGDILVIKFQVESSLKSGSIIPSGSGGFKLYTITTANGVLDEETNIITGASTFNLPTDCDISDSVNKPMIVLNPGRVDYTLSGTNGLAFITFSEPPLVGDVPEIYYSIV